MSWSEQIPKGVLDFSRNSASFLDGVSLNLFMSKATKVPAERLTPILYVRDFQEAMKYYTEKLLFERLWDWGDPPTFGAVRLG